MNYNLANFVSLWNSTREICGEDNDVRVEYDNVCALFNTWTFMDNEEVPQDHEDFRPFLKDNNLTNFSNVMILLQIALTIPVSPAHDERSFSCLMRVKTYMR